MMMEKARSIRFLVTQLSSLVEYLNKMVNGTLSDMHLEMMIMTNNVLKDCIILQKSIKLEYVKPDVLGKLEGLVSEGDYYKIGRALENVQPCINISEERIARITGPRDPSGKLRVDICRDNIVATYEMLKNKLNADEEKIEELQDLPLYSVEAAYEVIRRLISQYTGIR